MVFEGFLWFELSLFMLKSMQFGIKKNIGRTVHLGTNFCLKFGDKMRPKSTKKLIKSDPKTISENYSQNMSFWRPLGIPFGTLWGVLWETFWEPFWHSCSLLRGLGGLWKRLGGVFGRLEFDFHRIPSKIPFDTRFVTDLFWILQLLEHVKRRSGI